MFSQKIFRKEAETQNTESYIDDNLVRTINWKDCDDVFHTLMIFFVCVRDLLPK